MRETIALDLAQRGYFVFPIEPNGKTPVLKNWQDRATRDPEQIARWFRGADRNVGIYTGRFGDDQALIVVDVDTKHDKNGELSLLQLELEGNELPRTAEQTTPSGGRHIIYAADKAYRQGVDVLGSGLDIRSRGGYIVGPGSEIDGKPYSWIRAGQPQPAPEWLRARLGVDRFRADRDRDVLDGIDPERAVARAVAYLESAPRAVEGNGGDLTTYKVAAQLKDLGCSKDQALSLLISMWNDECDPPWEPDELAAKIDNAYDYGREPQGADAPEAVFTAAETPAAAGEGKRHPLDEMSRTHAFVKKGGYILEEGVDHKGKPELFRHTLAAFHAWSANRTLTTGDKQVPMSKLWMSDSRRREYVDVIFDPACKAGPDFYNLWRGFAYQPAQTLDPEQPGLKAWRHHLLANVCNGDAKLAHWLTGWFAHLVQRPGEKPLVATVFKGRKGVGKNALVERVGELLGRHAMTADDDRYLLSNFNSHMEDCLMMILDEACWAGDKRAEGKLKGLITGKEHIIERKGFEATRVDNLTRVVIIGNENWLVPATEDERRFAVFSVGEGNMQDRQFFISMKRDLAEGGYPHLLRYLLDFDLASVDVDAAPHTAGLVDQKLESLPPLLKWWFASLSEGDIAGGDFDGWPETVPTKRLQAAFERFAKGRNTRALLPDPVWFGREMATCGLERKRRAKAEDGSTYVYVLKPLAEMRRDFERRIGGDVNWPKE